MTRYRTQILDRYTRQCKETDYIFWIAMGYTDVGKARVDISARATELAPVFSTARYLGPLVDSPNGNGTAILCRTLASSKLSE